MSGKYLVGDTGEKYPVYRIGDVILTEAKVVEVDDDIDDVKVRIGAVEIWLKQSQVRQK